MRTKRCSKCGEIKSVNRFYKDKNRKDGVGGYCKECQKKWQKNNPEKIRKAGKKYRKNNPEKVREQYKKWREDNPEYDKKWRENNPEKVRKSKKKYYQKNKEKIKETQKIWREDNPIKFWCLKTIATHKHKGYKVLFKSKDLLPIAKQTKKCSICDVELDYSHGNKAGKPGKQSPSLDRIDNNKVLTLSNTQIICHRCNATKRDRSMKEMFEWCENFINKFVKRVKN